MKLPQQAAQEELEEMKCEAKGFQHLLAATKNSLRGIRDAFKTAAAFRQECVLCLLNYVGLCLVPMRFDLRLALAASGLILLTAELLNSAVEAVVDLVSPEWNLQARYAKDFGSAAVFMILVLMAGLWIVVAVMAL